MLDSFGLGHLQLMPDGRVTSVVTRAPLRTFLLDDDVIVVSPRQAENPADAHAALDQARGYAAELQVALGLRARVITAPAHVEVIDQRLDKTPPGSPSEG